MKKAEAKALVARLWRGGEQARAEGIAEAHKLTADDLPDCRGIFATRRVRQPES